MGGAGGGLALPGGGGRPGDALGEAAGAGRGGGRGTELTATAGVGGGGGRADTEKDELEPELGGCSESSNMADAESREPTGMSGS